MPAGVCLALPTGPQCFPASAAAASEKLMNRMDNRLHVPDLLVDTSLATYQNCLVFSHGIVMREASRPQAQQATSQQDRFGSLLEDRFVTIGSGDELVEEQRQCSSNSGDSGFGEDSDCPSLDRMSESLRTIASDNTLPGQRSHIRIITPSVASSQDMVSAPNNVSTPLLSNPLDWTPSKHLVVSLPPVAAPRQHGPQKQSPQASSPAVQANPFRVSPQFLDTNPFKTLEDVGLSDTNPFRQSHSPVSMPVTNPFWDDSVSPAVQLSPTNPFIVADSTFAADLDKRRELVPSPVMVKGIPSNSQWDLDTLAKATRRLEMSGFYYPDVTMQEAKIKLRDSPEGTFLVRNSSQPNYIFSISAKTCRGTTSVRVEYSKGRFKLDTEGPSRTHFPSFDCIIKLLQFYVKVSTEGKGRSCVYAETSGRRDTPVIFRTPLRQRVSSLGHLARRAVNKCVARGSLDDLPIQRNYVNFLVEYPFWL